VKMQHEWLCLSVDKFVNQSNWEGKVFTEPLQVDSLELNLSQDWQLLSVKDFFNSANWSGKVSSQSPTTASSLLEPSSYLTTSVGKFFNSIPWNEGQEVKPASQPIAKVAKKVETPPPPPPKTHTIDDLAQLF
jgi:hypothetical protein